MSQTEALAQLDQCQAINVNRIYKALLYTP